MKRFFLAALLIILIAGAVIYAKGYHGIRTFSCQSTTLPDVAQVVDHARSLRGTPYDPLMGSHGNLGARAGFIVCADVPNLAYGLAGYSLQSLLEQDFRIHAAAYNPANGNVPGNPYFHRRARNLYAYFQVNGRLLPPGATPRVGDLVFYHHSGRSFIAHVALVTEVSGNSYRVMESAPDTVFAGEVAGTSPVDRGWGLAGFGRMYGDGVKI
jgi:uncharacterized protein YijF (DUF1287 family)